MVSGATGQVHLRSSNPGDLGWLVRGRGGWGGGKGEYVGKGRVGVHRSWGESIDCGVLLF